MPATSDKPAKPNRQGEAVNFWLRGDLAAALRAFLESLRPKPTRTAVIEDALEVYLESKGFWPPAGEPGDRD